MSSITNNEIRSYLLGTLADIPRERIEETLLVSDDGLMRLEIAEEDVIEEFLDDQLNAKERELFERYFLCTSARKEKLAYLRAIRAVAIQQAKPEPGSGNVISFPDPQTRKGFFGNMNRSGYLKLVAAILVICSTGLLLWQYAIRPQQNPSLVALNRAYATGRPLETRIGGFDFAPYAPTRGANDTDATTRILRERAERILLDAIADNPSAANKHALGKYYLADKSFDKAIEQFNAALKETPNFAELHNDLGAALLEKSKYEKRNNQPGDSLQHLAASLESIQQSLKLQPNYPAAVFNRALCLQEMYLPRQAIEEWKKYLQLDAKSPWADEARRRLADLEKAPSNISKSDDELYQEYLKDPSNDERTFDLFCQAYSTTGNGITERLIDDYLAAKQSNNETEATYKSQLLEKLGTLIYQRTTDPYVRDVARYYRQVSPRLLPKLVEARHDLNQGRELRTTKQSEAVTSYQKALSLFQQTNDKCEARMTVCLLARSNLRQLNYDKCYKLFKDLATSQNGYLWLRGQSLNGLAEYYQEHSQPDESILANKSSLTLASQTSNTSLKLTSLVNLAFLYHTLGDWEQTLVYQQRALEVLAQSKTDPLQHWATNAKAAENLVSFGFRTVALVYIQEALSLEQINKLPLQLSRTYTHFGVMLGKDKRFLEAISLVKKAIDIGSRLENENVGRGIQIWSGLCLAALQYKAGEYPAALQSYERVINLNRQFNNPAEDFEIYRGKALTEIALGHTVQAKQDLEQALIIFERNRNQIFAEDERNTYFDKEYEIYDAAIGFAYADNPRAAFDLSENGRARSLLELLKGSPGDNSSQTSIAARVADRTQPLASKAVQQQLANGTSILEFACLPDQLLVWGISANGFTHSQNAIPLPLLEQKVHAFLQALNGKTPADISQAKVLSAELYQILIEPLESFLAKAETVCIVPDKVLHLLPFAALFSVRQQKYLVEKWALIAAPSTSVFILCNERARRRHSNTNERVLSVGNPRFDQTAYAQLSDLTAATREANDVASSYTRSVVLTAEQATEQGVKAEIKNASIIHLATHGVIDERSSTNSRLVLAKPTATDGEDGALRAYEIAQMRLPHTRLVVLSACQSGVGRFYRGEGMIGLSRAFLAAGVPTVVASLWVVDSEVTAALMTDFHQQLKQYSASHAIRRAQLALLHDANLQYHSPYYWAAFSTFGGDWDI